MKEERSTIKSDILTRVRILYIIFIIIGGAVLCRLVYVQLFSLEVAYNAKRLESRIFVIDTLPQQRGSILSRNGEPLATSIFRYQVEFDFACPGFDSLELFREHSDSLSKLLAGFFQDRSADQYLKMFLDEHSKHYKVTYRKDTTVVRSEGFFSRFIDRMRGEEYRTVKLYDTMRNHRPVRIFPRDVDYAEWQELRKFPILNRNMGITYRLAEKDERVYPQGELARRTIGLKGDQGNYGIEAVYSKELAGVPGVAMRQRIAPGFYGRIVDDNNTDPIDGYDITTTLDLDLQDEADKALRNQLQTQNAIWGTSMVMETSTGDILAMANLGRSKSGDYVENKNYALGSRMEPGSTFKLAAMLALLEDCRMSPSQCYDSGSGQLVHVGRAAVQDSHNGGGVVNLKTAVSQSLNVYFAKAVFEHYKQNPQRYVDFLKGLHLNRPMGLEDFGEKTPLLPEPTEKYKRVGAWSKDMSLPNMGYGYAIELAPIHTLTLYNAIANGGRMVAPRLIKEVRQGGKIIDTPSPKVLVEQVCSPKNLSIVREYLEEVCRTGTAKSFFGDTTSVRVAGKTGTAKFAQGGIRYSDGYYLGTMVCYLPADNPRYTIYTAIFTRRGNGTTYYGAGLSGPVQKQLVNYIYNREHDWRGRIGEADASHYPRHIKSGNIASARRLADKFSPHASFDKRSGWGDVRVDSMSNVVITSKEVVAGVMPNVVGMGLKDALFILENMGLRVTFTGCGAVTEQSVTAGAKVAKGMAVTITLN